MSGADHTRSSEDLAAYLLGALSPEEAAEFERHAEGCASCRAEMRRLAPAVDVLPETVERQEAPAGLRDRLMAEVRADAAERRRAESSRSGQGRPMLRRPLVGLAVALLVAVGVASLLIGTNGSGDRSGGRAIVSGHAPGIVAKLDRDGDRGRLQLVNVRSLPENRVLEAWVERDGEVTPVRALFVPDGHGLARTTIDDMNGVETVMVTAEPPGGSEAPTSAPLVTMRVE